MLVEPKSASSQKSVSTWRQRVSHAFSRAAPNYTDRAWAQHAMGETLWKRLPSRAGSVLDLGCGPGHWTARLSSHYRLRATGLDIAPGMLIEARLRHGTRGHWLCGDACKLPLISDSVELIFSNLAIQWCRDPGVVFAELHRVLSPGGCALINTLVPGTLAEVAHAWARPGQPAIVERFPSSRTVYEAAHRAGFHAQLEQAAERFHYPDITAVMTSIKGIGAQVARSGAALTRRDLARAAQRYETLRQPEGLPVTYQRLSLQLYKRGI